MEGLFYLFSENKGADQLRSYCAADLRLYFRICKKPVFSQRGSYLMFYRQLIKRSLILQFYVHISQLQISSELYLLPRVYLMFLSD